MRQDTGQSLDSGSGSLWHTRWTEIRAARTFDAERRREALGRIMGRYWRPLYVYLHRRGRNDGEAEDLVQGFITEVVLRRGRLIQEADPGRGKFRTFLLTALDNYVRDVHEKETAKKRRPAEGVASLDAFEAPPPVPAADATPEEAFTYAWASGIVDDVLADVEAQCRQARQEKHWEVFRRTVVEPALFGAEAPSMQQLCDELGIAAPKKAAAMNVVVKRRFQRVMRMHVRQFVARDEDVDGEIGELTAILSRNPIGK